MGNGVPGAAGRLRAGDYHLGEYCAGFSQEGDRCELRFVTGRVNTADLVVFADGITSTARGVDSTRPDREYSGYVGWRGTVREDQVSDQTRELLADALTYSVAPNTHAVMYTIPGVNGELNEGGRLLNYVWYRNVADGPDLKSSRPTSAGSKPPSRCIPVRCNSATSTRCGNLLPHNWRRPSPKSSLVPSCPTCRCVFDTASRRWSTVVSRSSATRPSRRGPTPRPGSAKAAADAWALYERLGQHDGGIVEALKLWEPGQLELGNRLIDRVSAMGARSQFTNTWVPSDPDLRFGLYGPGK